MLLATTGGGGPTYTGTPSALSLNATNSTNTISNSQRTARKTSGSGYTGSRSIDGKVAGRYYVEVVIDNRGGSSRHQNFGICNSDTPLDSQVRGKYILWVDGTTPGVTSNGTGGGSGNFGSSFTAGDVLSMDVDFGAGTIKFRQNAGAWSSAYNLPTSFGPAHFFVQNYDTGDQITVRFNHSEWTQTPPAGCDQWSTNTSYAGRYWRLTAWTSNNNGGQNLAEVELRATSGGADQTGSGTATANTYYGSPGATYQPSNAVDNNTATMWASAGGDQNSAWWQYDFGSTTTVQEAKITVRSDVLQYMAGWHWDYSADGSTWYLAECQTDQAYTQGGNKTYAIGNNSLHRYWRVKCYSVGGHPTSAWNVGRLEMAESINGIDVCTGGTAAASTNFDAGHNQDKAFDKDASTFWSASAFAYGDYLQYDFGAGVTKNIVEVRTSDRNDNNIGYNMTYGELFWSDDGTTWTSSGYLGGPVTTVNGQMTVYRPNPVDATAYRYWKVTCTGNTPGNFGVSEFALAAVAGGPNVVSGGTITASADDGVDHIANAIDGNVSTCYGAAGGMPRYIQYDFGAGVTKNIVEVKLTSRNDGYYTQNLMQGYIEASNDGASWTKIAFLANTVSVANAEVKTFPVVPITVSPAIYTGPGHPYHRYWRVNATSTGNGNFGFAEMAVAASHGGADIASKACISASTDDGTNHIANGFDGNNATCYGASAGLPRHVDFDFSFLFPSVEELRITSRDGGNYAQNVTAGKVQYSDDASTWTDYWTITAAAATTNNQVITVTS